MQLIPYTKPKMIVADKGKHIRYVNDIYVAEHTDEEGNIIPEYIPHYTTTIFVPDDFTKEQMNEFYVEEKIEGISDEELEQEELSDTELKARAYDIITGEVE